MSRESQLVDEQVNIYDVARRYKLDWGEREIGKNIQILCPMHSESNPSCRIYANTNSGYCWTCQKSFGPTGLVVALEGCSWGEATRLLAQWYQVDLTPDPDEEEAHRLIQLASTERPVEQATLDEQRRYAAMARRCVGLSWAEAERLIELYELLDLTDIPASEWIWASPNVSPALQ
jgi:DNA primase